MKHFFVTAWILTILTFAEPGAAQESSGAAALFQQICALCHGEKLQGGKAQSLVDGVWQFGEARGSIGRNIKHGLTHVGMPAFEGALTDGQIESLVDYLLRVERELGVTKPPPPEEIQTLEYVIKVDIWAEGLKIPWAIDFAGEDLAFVTERPGRLRVVRRGKLVDEPVAGTPSVLHQGQGGLMDVAVDPEYADNGWVYLAYSQALEKRPDERRPRAMTRIVRGRVRENKWVDEQVVYQAPEHTYRMTRHHYGCRIVFDPEGYLYFAIGDRGHQDEAQDISRPNRRVSR